MMIPVKGHPNLYRDEITGAIVNCDSQGYNQYILAKNNKHNEKKEIDNMKKDIAEIKSMLREILNGSK